MIKTIMWIVFVLLILGFIALFIWGDKIEPGTILAGLVTFIAALKSKLLGTGNLKERIEEIRSFHELKRSDWEKEKKEMDMKYEVLKLKMDTLDIRTEMLKEKLEQTRKSGYKPNDRTEKEILEFLSKE